MRNHRQRLGTQRGFSLIEMLVVVGIMATVAAIGVPKYQRFMAAARQSEAKNNLSHIYTLQQTYIGDNEVFAAFGPMGGSSNGCSTNPVVNPINFKVPPCNLAAFSDKQRYLYEGKILNAGANFKARAKGGNGSSAATNFVGGTQTADEWVIDDNKDLCFVYDSANKASTGTGVCAAAY